MTLLDYAREEQARRDAMAQTEVDKTKARRARKNARKRAAQRFMNGVRETVRRA